MRLFIIRHGQTEWNVQGRCQGHTDIALDAEGTAQAMQLAENFACDYPVESILSSDLSRCIQTAKPLATQLGAPLVLDERLRERSFGAWEGQIFSEMLRTLGPSPTARYEFRPPGGESLQDVWDRLNLVVAELRELTETAIVVTHGGTGTLLLSQLIGGSLETARSLSFGNTAIAELEKRAEGHFTLRRYNDTSHLSATAAIGGGLDGTHR